MHPLSFVCVVICFLLHISDMPLLTQNTPLDPHLQPPSVSAQTKEEFTSSSEFSGPRLAEQRTHTQEHTSLLGLIWNQHPFH
ncbi:unnamed protein product [Menidia menidia]|uniref:(Atlantic silverside) hypothetical protein n=1 Tax=Menidia menidia TaxID=238744 RepID=A0A8S4BP91_9TELE|nr:unnamed protein product [Menidia menidia]